MGAKICQSISESGWAISACVCDFIYDFQTLIAAVIAIGAAWYAGSPVWQQLKDSNLQTYIMQRDTLAARLIEAEQRVARVAAELEGPLRQAQRVTMDASGEPIEVLPYDAFGVAGMLEGCADWYLVTLRGTEGDAVEKAKNELKQALDDLRATLSDVHWPVHNEQMCEDHNFTDVEWAEVERKAKEGAVIANEKVSTTLAANRALRTAQNHAIDEIRKRISRLDHRISGGA